MDKQSYVNNIFSSVSNKYDVMNDLMSLGLHRYWKQKFIDKITNYSSSILDVACGSGDIIKGVYKRSRKYGGNIDITGIDINEEMLEIARNKLIDDNILNAQLLCGSATELPFPDCSFDYYLISFGIRNIADINKSISEAYRVLKPGGCFLCLEFSKVQNPLFDKIYQSYSKCIPTLGNIVAKDKSAYQYLVDSIASFYSQEELVQILKSNNFVHVSYQNLTMGVVAIHEAYKQNS